MNNQKGLNQLIMHADNHSNQSILIVDNNIQDTEDLQYWFRQKGYQVDIVTQPLQAVSLIREKEYRLVLIDINLGYEMGGFGAIWLLKTFIEGVQFVLLSDAITRDNERKAASYGVMHWIHKSLYSRQTPVKLETLLRI